MKITIAKTILENILSSLQPFLEKKDNSQITSHIYFEAKESQLIVRATDYEIGLQVSANEVNITETGECTANGKKLLDIVRILKDEDVTLEQIDHNLSIKQKRSNFKLPTFVAAEFPKFPEFEHLPKIGINSLKLINSFKKITSSIDSNNPKFELNGALIDIKMGGVNIVSTDTKRLAIVSLDEKTKDEIAIIVPKKAILEIQKLFFDDVEMFYGQTNLIVKSKNQLFFTKLINGKFPDYHRILPKEFSLSLTLPKEKMIDSIKQVNIVSSEVKLNFTKSSIEFESLTTENIEAKTEIEQENQVEKDFYIAFNSRFLLDFLSNIETKDFTVSFNESNMPFEVKSDNFTTIIMPVTI